MEHDTVNEIIGCYLESDGEDLLRVEFFQQNLTRVFDTGEHMGDPKYSCELEQILPGKTLLRPGAYEIHKGAQVQRKVTFTRID